MTGGTVQEELREFTTRLFEQTGGVVEWSLAEGAGTAVVPPETAALLPLHREEFRLTERPGEPGLCVSLATDFLDVAGTVLAAAVPRVGAFHVPERYLKKGDLQEAIDQRYTWLNARVRVGDAHPTSVEYHTWWFLASLRSDDFWESRLAVVLNSASLVEVELPDLLGLPDLQPHSQPETPPAASYDRAVARAEQHLKQAAQDFIRRMDARLARDQKRLHDYYGALLRESAGTHRRRSAPPPDPEQVAAKQRAVQLELRRKLSELEERYTMQAQVRPLVLIRTTLPTLAIELSVRRKQAERTHTVHWNSLLKQFEPIACTRCGRGVFSLAFTNEEVAPLCASCAASGKNGAAQDHSVKRPQAG